MLSLSWWLENMMYKFLKNAGLVSIYNLSGRSANVLLPFFVIHYYGTNDTTDFFFLGLSVSFYFYGTLLNTTVDTSIPLLIRQNVLISTKHLIYLSILAIVMITLFLVNYRSLVSVSEFWFYLISFCGITACALLSVRDTIILFSSKKFLLPNILWALRFLPILFVIWRSDNDIAVLVKMTLLLLLVDFVRMLTIKASSLSLVLVEPIRISGGQIGKAMLLMVLATMIHGLNPIVDRLVASFSEPGAVSVLDMSERLFSILHAGISIGFMSVLLVDMTHESRQSNLEKYWKKMMMVASFVGIGGIILLIILSFFLLDYYGSITLPHVSFDNRQRMIDCVLFYSIGIPALMIGGVCIKLMLIYESYYFMFLFSTLSFGLNVILSLLFYWFLDIPGIALATSLTYLIVSVSLVIVCKNIIKNKFNL